MSVETVATGVKLTDAASAKVRELLAREKEGDRLALRVAVQPGGCSGLRYALYFDDKIGEADKVAEFGGVRLVVEAASVPQLVGAEVDYVDSLQKAGFTVNNPNATSTCACGDSFNC